MLNNRTYTGTINAVNQVIDLPVARTDNSWNVQVSGSFVGTIQTELSINDIDFSPVAYRQSGTGSIGNKITMPGIFRGNCGGASLFRVRAIGWTSGTANIAIKSGGVGAIFSNVIQEVRELAQYYASAAGGRVSFNVTSGSVAGNAAQLAMVLSNPAASPVDLYIERITLSNSVNGTWTRMRNSALTITGTSLVFQNRGGGANGSEARAYINGAVTATGGTTTSTTHVAAYIPFSIEEDGALILMPGQNAAWTFTPNAGGSYTAAINVVEWESISSL